MWTPRRSNGSSLSDTDNAHYKRSQMKSYLSLRSTRALVAVLVSLALLFLLVNQQGWVPSVSSGAASKTPIKTGSGPSTDAASGANPLDCKVSYDGKRPVTQYVVMIDAGSSGSRVHVYEFNNCQQMPRLVQEKFEMIDGGLSSYENDPEAAAKSLDVLLEVAVKTVPQDLQKCSPIAVKATAGLRKLGDVKSKAILDAVRDRLEKNYPFPIIDNGVTIMPGDEEGVYAWVTANYLLERIGTPHNTPTVAVFDLGGGSTQIVFEPTFVDSKTKLTPGDHSFEMTFGGRDFELYQHSYLGYGLNEARAKINKLIVDAQSSVPPDGYYTNPCIPPKSKYTAKVPSVNGGDREVMFKGPEQPSAIQCRAVAEKILEKDAVCANPPCSFGGVYQPRLFEAFPHESDMYVFSFFYDRTFPLGMPESFTLDELRDLTDKVCQGEAAYSSFAAMADAVPTLKENPQWCLDLNYMLGLLRTGYDIHNHREVRIAKKINNNELGWCLGASLPLLDGVNWKCKQTA